MAEFIRARNGLVRVMGGTAAGLFLVLVSAPTVLACISAPHTAASIALNADRIVLGRVIDRDGVGPWTYTIKVEQTLKGGPLPRPWIIEGAGAGECGMSRLDEGDRVVLEYYRPGRVMVKGPWFYAWTVHPDGTIAYSSVWEPPVPGTLSALLAEYRAAGLPDTATANTEPAHTPSSAPPVGLFLGLVGGLAWWLRNRRSQRARGAAREEFQDQLDAIADRIEGGAVARGPSVRHHR